LLPPVEKTTTSIAGSSFSGSSQASREYVLVHVTPSAGTCTSTPAPPEKGPHEPGHGAGASAGSSPQRVSREQGPGGGEGDKSIKLVVLKAPVVVTTQSCRAAGVPGGSACLLCPDRRHPVVTAAPVRGGAGSGCAPRRHKLPRTGVLQGPAQAGEESGTFETSAERRQAPAHGPVGPPGPAPARAGRRAAPGRPRCAFLVPKAEPPERPARLRRKQAEMSSM
jgi:hypothetical protein